VPAQRGLMSPEQAERRWATERELQSIAIVERKVMMPMRDGIRLATDIYRPKNATGKVRRPTTSTSGTSATAFPPT
jgi:predicted acyl esterase